MPHDPTTQPPRRWLWPTLIAVILFIGNLASNLGATWLVPLLEPYRNYVWAVIILALVVAIVVAVREARSPVPVVERAASPAITLADLKNTGNLAIGSHASVTIIQQPAPAFNPLHQLPSPPRDFTGREAELRELLAAMENGGAMISGLQGLGGVGKTALALVLAEKLKPRFPEAQFYLDLKGVSDNPLSPAEAMAHVIRAYHPTAKLPERVAELQPLYQSVLHDQRALLLMDNAGEAKQVEPLLPPATCLLLVTSRRHFTLPGLFAKHLDTLAPQESRGLLLKLAPRINEQAEDLARLCGHLPLALRLAGSALAERRDLSPADYARRLRQEHTRFQDVEASLSLSYALLTAALQKLWRGLAVFPETFAPSAAAAVWNLAADPAQDQLGELVRHSLVEWNANTGRYHLHDLARLFAQKLLPANETKLCQQRHAQHYAKILRRADELYLQGGEANATALALFDVERINIEAGQAWAAAHLAQEEAAAQLCADYPDAGVYVLDLRLHARERIRWLEAALAAARRMKNRRAEGMHLGNLGNAYAALGETRKAIAFYEQGLIIDREIGDRRGEGNALGNLGVAYADLGESRKAIAFYEQQLVIVREIGDRRGEGNALGNLGNAYAALGETRKAIEYHEQALQLTRELGDRRAEGAIVGNLGNAYAALGETRKAIEYHEQALQLTRELGDRRAEGAIVGNLGLAYAALGETRKAIEYHEQALQLTRELGDRRAEGAIVGNLGLAYAALGETRKAIAFYEQRITIAREIGDRRGEGNALGSLGNAYAALGETRKAIAFYEQQLVIVREIGDRRGEGGGLYNLADELQKLGERERAIPLAEAALQIFEQIEDPNAEQVRRKLAEWRGERNAKGEE